MLLLARRMADLSFPDLLQVYSGSIYASCRSDYGKVLAEQDFEDYLRSAFFCLPGALYAIWQSEGQYCAAVRLEPFKDGLLISALETAPCFRRQGYAQCLLSALQTGTDQKLYSHVDKKNVPSLSLHQKCGFIRIRDNARYLDGSVDGRCCTLLWEKR